MRVVVAIVALLVQCAALAGDTDERAIVGLDHIPLAVRDLGVAADSYARLGFALKNGRFHANGIRNQHVKFPDGTGIELITAAKESDALTGEYMRLLAEGEGPAFLALHTPELAAVTDRLDRGGWSYAREGGFVQFRDPVLHFIFIAQGDNRSPTDRPEHFAHSNTANDLIGVWIASDASPRLRRLFADLGGAVSRRAILIPTRAEVDVIRLNNGEITLLSASRQINPGRPVIGAVLRTRNLEDVRHGLEASGVSTPTLVRGQGYCSIFVEPRLTHGIWLEFRGEPESPSCIEEGQ
ncbi:MAG TPA: VOC family protein [Povalibacter sp.]|nr:VOC family protein [Povalibacter sp.]